VILPPGAGSWADLSDRDAKANFAAVDGRAILERLLAIPMQTWNYRAQAPAIRHLGPTAQDFHAAFGLGESDKHISTVDAQGVALAAIQGLYQVMQEKDAQLAAQQARLGGQEQALAAQQQELGALKGQLSAQQAHNRTLEARLAALERLLGTADGATAH
jgi:hypothetical protein